MLGLILYMAFLPFALVINCAFVDEDEYRCHGDPSLESKIVFFTIFYPLIFPAVLLMYGFCIIIALPYIMASLLMSVLTPFIRMVRDFVRQ